MKILIDADAVIGLYLRKDAHHSAVVDCIDWIGETGSVVFVTWDVIDEVATKLRYFVDKALAEKFLAEFLSGQYQVIFTDEDITSEAVNIFRSIRAKHTSLTDCMNIAVYRALDLDAIFSFDQLYKKQEMVLLEELVVGQ